MGKYNIISRCGVPGFPKAVPYVLAPLVMMFIAGFILSITIYSPKWNRRAHMMMSSYSNTPCRKQHLYHVETEPSCRLLWNQSLLYHKGANHRACSCTQALSGLPIRDIKLPAVKGSVLDYLDSYKNPCWFDDTQNIFGLRCLPYFYLLGVAKSGTTTLYQQLIQHPDIVPPVDKEIFYWDNVNKRKRLKSYIGRFGKAAFQIYRSREKIQHHHPKITFDATPAYFSSQGRLNSIPDNPMNDTDEVKCTLAHTLYALNPHTKLIVILREPTYRLFSHYHHFHKHNFSARHFHERAAAGIMMMESCIKHKSMRNCVFDSDLTRKMAQHTAMLLHYSLYYVYAKEWLSVFPHEQILFIKSTDLYTNTTMTVKKVFGFLDVGDPPEEVYHDIEKTVSDRTHREAYSDQTGMSYRSQLLPDTRIMLDNFFRPYNKLLADLLHNDKYLFLR